MHMGPVADSRPASASTLGPSLAILNPLPSPPPLTTDVLHPSSQEASTPPAVFQHPLASLPQIGFESVTKAGAFAAGVSRPAPVSAHPIVSAPALDQDEMNLIVGGALVPTPESPPVHTWPSRSGPGLRLPSFEALGIAAYRAGQCDTLHCAAAFDSVVQGSSDNTQVELTPPSSCDLSGIGSHPLPDAAKPPHPSNGGRAVPVPVRQIIAALTPPIEKGEQADSIMAVTGAALESPFSDPGQAILSDAVPGVTATAILGSGEFSRSNRAGLRLEAAMPWTHGALPLLLDALQSIPPPNHPLRVLTHALPIPSQSGHAFPGIIGAIHDSTPSSPTIWINVFHAIPGRFNLADIPTSPPNTPGPSVGGEDYFTQKVFDTAVPITDYQDDLATLPRSPHPIVPPASVNISIVERYIPPTNSNEFSSMFSLGGPSILVDRLVELSPQNGSLIFIYPTRAGAQTFLRDYLGPILDPLLRSIQVIYGLSSELGKHLGNMPAAKDLHEHTRLHTSITSLCAALSRESINIPAFRGRAASYTLVHSSKATMHPTREAWSRDWWAKQEKPKIRDAVTRFVQEAQKKSSNLHIERMPSPTELIQQLLDGVIKKQAYPAGVTPTSGIEVGVFVVRRTP